MIQFLLEREIDHLKTAPLALLYGRSVIVRPEEVALAEGVIRVAVALVRQGNDVVVIAVVLQEDVRLKSRR